MSINDRDAVFELDFICFRMQVLLLLAAMIVARSQCVQWALQQRGQNENAVIAVDKDFKSTGDQVAV